MKQDNDNEEPKVWVTVVKLVIGAMLLIGGVGLALWIASQGTMRSPALEQAQQEVRAKSSKPASEGTSWGIAKDSPLRK
ncbi:MAG: hypothetical protein V4858_26825 [Pseudomonadota bacterium]